MAERNACRILHWCLSSFVLGALLLCSTAQAQSTTAAIRVEVVDEAGAAIGDVVVNIVHVPTGQTVSVVTNAQGVATTRGLLVGGPYEVSLGAGGAYAADKVPGVMLELDETEVIRLTARPTTFEAIEVVAETVSADLEIGVGKDFTTETIEAIPSVARDFVSTLATEPAIVVDPSVDRGPAVSMAGQNFRFNNVTVDGIAQNDNFGLHMNASATQRTPISIDAIEALNVNIAPYDVSYGNFIGGNINIVTKSGTNEFQGGVFATATDDSLTGDDSKGQDLGLVDFEEQTYGGTLGGPIVRDKLFFFANYEKFETTRPSNAQSIGNIAGVTQADVDRAISIFQNEYGFDPGRFDALDDDEDEKILLKLAWNVSDSHRLIGTYQVTDGDVIFDDFPEVAVLQSNRYNINEELTAYSAQLFSSWTNTFSTELRIGTKDVERRDISVDPTTPDFFVTLGAGIAGGGDRFRHANELDNESDLLRIRGDYQLGNHLFTGGFEREKYTVRNKFLPFSKGQYQFGSLDDLENRNPFLVLYGNSNTGVQEDAETNFSLAVNSLYAQDEWSIGDNVTLKLGLRYDEYENDDQIVHNPFFTERNGFSNQENLDGKDLWLPRLGFNWTPNDRLTIHGGAGLFGGGTPLIILSNSYAGNGITRTFAACFAIFCNPALDEMAAAAAELPDPNAAFRHFQSLIGVNPVGDVDAIHPDYEPLSTWKYSLGADYEIGEGWLVSGGILYSDVKNGYNIYEGNRVQVGTAPDGRPIYNIPAGGDYIVTNTGEGKGLVANIGLQKTYWSDSWGTFDMSVGYTYQDIEELRSYNRFVGFETFAFDAQTDLNNPAVTDSTFEIEDRFTAVLQWSKAIFGENMTSIGLAYSGRSGRGYSYVFGSGGVPTFGGTFLADFGNEGDLAGSQLFYVPTGLNDPIITGDPAFLADLDAFISSNDCLDSNRGGIMKRNECHTSWIHIVNLRLTQEIRAWSDTAFDLYVNIENFGNLLNDDWGRVEGYAEPANVAPANVAIANGKYVLTPTASYNGTPESVAAGVQIARLPSAYRIQFGARFHF